MKAHPTAMAIASRLSLVRRLLWIDGMTRTAGRADPDNVFYHTITAVFWRCSIALRTRVFAPAIQQYL